MKGEVFISALIIVALSLFITNAFFAFQVIEQDIEMLRLQAAVNAASDAAVGSILDNATVGVNTNNFIKVDPNEAFNVFAKVLLKNYNISEGDEDIKRIKNNIPVAIITAGDGYYLGKHWMNGFDFEPKAPYMYTDSSGVEYALTLDHEVAWKLNKDASTGDIISIKRSTATNFPVLEWISDDLSDRMAYSIKRTNEELSMGKAGKESLFRVPNKLTKTGDSNPIRGIGLITLLQDVDFGTGTKLNLISVAGTRITYSRNVIGFVDSATGIKYYCYLDQLPVGTFQVNSGGTWIPFTGELTPGAELQYTYGTETFNKIAAYKSIQDAATDGYFPHNEYFLYGKKLGD